MPPVHAAVVVVAETNECFRIGNRQVLHQHHVHQGENRSVGTDPERQRQHRRGREPRRLSQLPDRVTRILANLFKPVPAPRAPGFFLQKNLVAKRAHGGETSFAGTHPCGDILGDLLVEMEANLLI